MIINEEDWDWHQKGHTRSFIFWQIRLRGRQKGSGGLMGQEGRLDEGDRKGNTGRLKMTGRQVGHGVRGDRKVGRRIR